MNVDDELHHLVNDWHRHTGQSQDCHYESGIYYERLFLLLGVIVIVCSAMVGGTDILMGLDNNLGGVISLIISIVAGLQTFLKYSQLSEKHRMAGARYGAIKRSLEEVALVLVESHDEAKKLLHAIKKEMDVLAVESPEINKRIRRKYCGDE